MKSVSLSHLTVLDVGPPKLISLAANAGFRSVGIRLCSPMPGGVSYPLRAGSAEMRDTLSEMRALDVTVLDIEVVRITDDTRIEDYESVFEAGAELGAKRVCINVDDAAHNRVVERLSGLCELAAPFGLSLDVEFMIWRPVARLQDAARLIEDVNKPNAFILLDALHLFRSGGTVADVAALDAGLIGSVQLCDAPLIAPPASEIIAEARGARLLPGEGELPLQELLAALPGDVPLSAEVPLAREPNLQNRAKLVHEATKRLVCAVA